jgi:hypothetical protein
MEVRVLIAGFKNLSLIAALVLVGFFFASLPGSASVYACKLSQDCFYCFPGAKNDDCSVTCDYCLGIRCLGPGRHEATGDFAPPEAEPLRKLERFPAEPFVAALGPNVRQVIEALWHWYDSPITLKREVLDLAGAIKVDGKAREFTLEIRQSGEQQLYDLRLEGEPRASWSVTSLGDSQVLVEFQVGAGSGDRERTGKFVVDKPLGVP